MVFSAALHTTTTTGTSLARKDEPVTQKEYPIVDPQPESAIKHHASDKHDVLQYTITNASFMSLAGLVAGLQQAYYAFEKMPGPVTRRTWHQAGILASIVGRKTLLGATLGAAFCYTEATLENMRHKDDIWNGMAGGAVAGFVFSLLPPKPLPQPIAWPLAFAAVAAGADIVGEVLPQGMQGFKSWGTLPGRESWNDPEPPRPPILDTGAGARPKFGHFWRGA